MAPSEAPQTGHSACNGGMPPAVPSRLIVLKKRAEFQRASRGKRVVKPGFILQMIASPPEKSGGIRVGFTCSKKVGNAVKRNRAKRRLRELARLVLPEAGQPGHDYVLVGRHTQTGTLPFDQLSTDLRDALARLHEAAK